MSEKRYPTRMHEVLGVATGQVFYFETTSGLYQEYVLDAKGHLFRNHKTQRIESPRTMADIINHPERITRRPRLTEEQVDELKAAVKLGLFWLAKDESGTVSYYRDEPCRKSGCYQWFFGSSIQSLRPPQCSDVASLVSWSDPAPLDIVQTLRDAGVEVE